MEFYFNHINALRVEPRIEKLLSLASATPSSLALMKGHSRLHLVETPAAQLHAGETWSCGGPTHRLWRASADCLYIL